MQVLVVDKEGIMIKFHTCPIQSNVNQENTQQVTTLGFVKTCR